MHAGIRHGFGRAVLLATALAGADAAAAAELNYSLEMALGHSDNINQSGTDPVDQSLLIPRLNFDFLEEGSSFRARAVGRVEYRDYLGGAFGNEVRGQLAGVATWMILPQRLNFDFEDYAAVQPVNILAPNTPNNQQQTNVLTLGPTFNFRLDPTLNGQAEMRLTDSTASQTKEFNSQRVLAALRAIKDLSTLDHLSANIEAQRVHFSDPSGGPDYDRVDGYARYQKKLTQLDLDLALGYSRVSFDGAGERSAPTAHGSVTWRATPMNTLSFGVVRRYSDATQDMAVDPGALVATTLGSGIVVGTATVTSQVYLEKRFESSYVFHDDRLQVRVAPYYRTLDYLLDPTIDQRAHGVTAGVSYRARPLWTVAFDANEETREYAAIRRRDEDLRLDLSFTDQLSRHWAWRFDLIRNERHTDVADQGFGENVVFFTLIFKR